ncbi:Hypothetical protein Ccan_21860 [Capnocytophaga canimorsus Cc5]|uniref:Uncharacterized protein n=1 Tax=Capnocytophaga canimorsus (strain 5) TaxID=860228 RepID=F9YUZ2_CAPCC|nr:Hypothetical protein Ccan_21860 [Capnocytophaga canimorsus Cc5]
MIIPFFILFLLLQIGQSISYFSAKKTKTIFNYQILYSISA